MIPKFRAWMPSLQWMCEVTAILFDEKSIDVYKTDDTGRVTEMNVRQNKSRFSSLYNVYSWLGFKVSDVSVWVNENQDIFAHAWLNGYEVEKEKRYKIIILNPDDSHIMLFKLRYTTRMFFRGSGFEGKSGFECKLTEKEVREHGFGWVFDCEGVKVEEVE